MNLITQAQETALREEYDLLSFGEYRDLRTTVAEQQARIKELEAFAAMNGEENARYYQMAKKEVWEAADKRIAQLEDALYLAKDALMMNIIGTSGRTPASHDAINRINEVIGS